MRLTSSMRAVCALAVLLALALPASAFAVPTVTSVVAKTGDAGVTFLTDPTGATLTSTQTRYVVSADGWVAGFGEDNGVTGGGVIDYSVLPASYRAPMTADDKRTYGPAQTDVQPHATCSGVAALASGTTVLAWQGSDPSYAYVPWQKASAGLGDDPARWIPVVRSATGVDLSALASAADARAACERLGGTYHAADTATSIASALVAAAVAPLNTQIASLTRARATADRAAATARAAQKAAEELYQSFFTRPLALTLSAKRFAPAAGVAVMLTGAPTDPVALTLEVGKQRAKRLGLSSRVLAEASGEISAEGALLLTLAPGADVLARLAKRSGRVPAVVSAVSGGNADAAKVTLVLKRAGGKAKAS